MCVQFGVCAGWYIHNVRVGVRTVRCVWVQGHCDTLRWAAGDEFYIPHWRLTNLLLTTEVGVSPPHSVYCMESFSTALYLFSATFYITLHFENLKSSCQIGLMAGQMGKSEIISHSWCLIICVGNPYQSHRCTLLSSGNPWEHSSMITHLKTITMCWRTSSECVSLNFDLWRLLCPNKSKCSDYAWLKTLIKWLR